MDPDFWQERWVNRQTGFHQDNVNPHLERHWHSLGLAVDSRVLVPLCGKSLDMVWLRQQGHSIAGIEISALAVAAFFSEQGLTPSIRQGRAFSCWSAEGIDLYCGDFFSLPATELGQIDACYDRAALVAMPATLRPAYASHLASLLPSSATGLLVTLEYEPTQIEGPPFSVSRHEVRQLFAEQCRIEHLDSRDALGNNVALKERGLAVLHEDCFRLVRN
jgi:thiopurine S-methyltransferase